MERARSEYRLRLFDDLPNMPDLSARHPADADRDALAQLLLDAYRGTIDDEGEDLEDAFDAIDHYLRVIHRDRSFVVERAGEMAAACFTLTVADVLYIDPIIVATAHQRSGLGGRLVLATLHHLTQAAAGKPAEVGATITDGNIPSERLFARLGFVRVGAWT